MRVLLGDTRSAFDFGSVRTRWAFGRHAAGSMNDIALKTLRLLEGLADGTTKLKPLATGGGTLMNTVLANKNSAVITGRRLPRGALAVAVLVAVAAFRRSVVKAVLALAVRS